MASAPRIAVLTLTRNRFAYTRHCFASLKANAGTPYDHFVLDQGSTDGSREWLQPKRYPDPLAGGLFLDENIGISRGMNLLLDTIVDVDAYDVIVKLDNDCELTQPNTLRDVCALTLEGQALLSPRILGLNHPPAATGEFRLGDEAILGIPQIGGIFLAAPAWIYNGFRYSEDGPTWGGDDVEICHWFRRTHGGTCGYVKRLEAWHYETTNGQHARFPDYFAQKQQEGKAVL